MCDRLVGISPGGYRAVDDNSVSQNVMKAKIREDKVGNTSESFFDISEIFPNPFVEQVNFSVNSNKKQTLYISFFNSLGQLIYTNQITVLEGEKLYSIQLYNKNMSNGIYQMKITNNRDITLSKLISYFNLN